MSTIANDRFLIAIGQKIEPRIYRTLSEAEHAAEILAWRSKLEATVYRLSDAARVSVWRGGVTFELDRAPEPFRDDGFSWLDKPASTGALL